MLLYCLYMYANIKLVNGDISHENLQNFLTEENNDIYIYVYRYIYTCICIPSHGQRTKYNTNPRFAPQTLT